MLRTDTQGSAVRGDFNPEHQDRGEKTLYSAASLSTGWTFYRPSYARFKNQKLRATFQVVNRIQNPQAVALDLKIS
jgi:hypothetical protein